MAQETENREEKGGQETGTEALAALLAPYRAFITYVPLRTEVPFQEFVTLPRDATHYEIAPRASLNPAEEALRALEAVGDVSTAILMPGRSFDASGTRHGQGGGWYDRFLALVPREWYRVGFCTATQFSKTPLMRQAWDQPMDAIVVTEAEGVRVYEAKRV